MIRRSQSVRRRRIVRKPGTGRSLGRTEMARDSNSDRLGRSPIHLLHRAGQCAEDIFRAEMGDRDLTPRQLAVLTATSEDEGLSQTGLVERTGIDRSTLADMVRRLQ